MKLVGLKRFLDEDFKDQRPWIEKLIRPINKYFTDISSILNRGITIADNLNGQTFSVELGPGKNTFLFKWDAMQLPNFVAIGQIIEVGASSVPPTGFTWYFADGAINCVLTGLNASASYRITIQALV